MKLSKLKSLIENSIKEIKSKKQLNEQGGAMQPGQQMVITCPGGFSNVTSTGGQQGNTMLGSTQITLGCSGLNPNSPGGPNFIPKVPKRR